MALTINGRFFENQGKPCFVNAVTYGPFPPEQQLDPSLEFPRISAAGFNAIRLYGAPNKEELDLAEQNNLVIFATVPWYSDSLFTENPDTIGDAKRDLSLFLTRHGKHPALAAVLIANEIRPDLVRFMGPVKVREVLEDIITECRKHAPALLYAYANFPTTEYLEPRNADFTAFNVYLEEQSKFESYLQRLHNIAGDRPLLLTEFGFNTWTEGAPNLSNHDLEKKQSEMLSWAFQSAQNHGTAGFTVYSWCDLWFNGGREILDWSFGLTRRDGTAKPALATLSKQFSQPKKEKSPLPLFTIAICTRDGGHRLKKNLPHFEQIEDPKFELIIIDDGSTDETDTIIKKFIAGSHLNCHLLTQPPSGLSAARNHAAREGKGEFIVYIDDDARPYPQWLHYLRQAFAENPKAAAAGGPNLPPTPVSRQNAIVTACAGNASHILFNDTTAEHLPGCNFALRRELLLEIGGFDKRFHAAGDDVDVCWRLLDAGHELAFHPAAYVFHDRRPTIKGFLRQQRGYGEAEALLFQKHPERFGSNGIRWQGFIYSGAPLTVDHNSVIYHGPMGEAPFQILHLTHMPTRPLSRAFDTRLNRFIRKGTEWLARYQRRETRKENGGPTSSWQAPVPNHDPLEKKTRRDYPLSDSEPRARVLKQLLDTNWNIASDESEADLQRGPIRLILAQTPVEGGHYVLHLRVLHPPIDVSETLAEIENAITQSPSS
ncbi:MAG: glycosyltransferase [Roseibacillus sp.]